MDFFMKIFAVFFLAFLATGLYLMGLQELHKRSKGIPVDCESMEEIYKILAEKLKCSFMKEIRINEKQNIEFQCKYDTHIGMLKDGKFYIDKLSRKFSSHRYREVEEAWYLQKYVEGVFGSELVEGEVLEQRFAKYIKIYNVSRVIKYAVYVCIAIWIFSKIGGNGEDINVMENQDDELSETTITSNDGKYRIGDTIQLYSEKDTSQAFSVTLTKWGQLFGTVDGNLIYVDYTIKNTGTSNIIVGDSLFDIYADNNKVELLDGENSIWSEEISSGREARGTLYAKIVPKRYTLIEVECGGCAYLLWDASFVKPLLGSYSWEKGDEGANITIKTAKAYSGDDYLIIEGECWKGDDYGNFRTEDQLSYDIDADANKDTGSIEFYDIESNRLVISPTEGGIYVNQSGAIWSQITYSWTNELSFAGTYSKGTAPKPKFDETNLESLGNSSSDGDIQESLEESTIDEELYNSELQEPSSVLLNERYISNVSASSELSDSTHTYGVDALFDDKRDTCWVEGVDGNGEGEYVEIQLIYPTYLTDIYFLNGYMKNEDVYNKNGKIRRVELSFSDGTSYNVDFEDCTYQEVEDKSYSNYLMLENPIYTDYIRITILEAEAGEKYDDICLSELELWGYFE